MQPPSSFHLAWVAPRPRHEKKGRASRTAHQMSLIYLMWQAKQTALPALATLRKVAPAVWLLGPA